MKRTTWMARLLPGIMISGMLVAAASGPASAQSFNCRYAKKPDEVLICQQPDLGRLDEQMAQMYYRILSGMHGYPRKQLKADQAAWLRSRYGCGYDAGCIRAHYLSRIAELGRY